MLQDNRLANRESHSSAFARLLGREKRIEDSFAIALGDSRSAILEQQPEIFAHAICSRLSSDLKSPTSLTHGIERVDHQVDEDLLKLACLALYD